MKKHEIKNIFFIKDKGLIIIHLKEFDWDFKSFGIVYLCYDEQRIKMNYTGFGNHEGNPALSLNLDDTRYNSINEIESEVKNNKRDYFLARDL
jgi:hypothetical protein